MTDSELFVSITRNPNDWEITKYRATYAPTGTVWWTGNGFMFFSHYDGPRIALPLNVRWMLWNWLKLLPLRQKGIVP